MKEKEDYAEELTGKHRHHCSQCKKRMEEMKELIADNVPARVARNTLRRR